MKNQIVSHEEWLAARRALLEKEKEFTRMGDEMSRLTRELSWEAVEKACVFDGAVGRETLALTYLTHPQVKLEFRNWM